MQVAVVKLVDVVAMLNCGVAATSAVQMWVIMLGSHSDNLVIRSSRTIHPASRLSHTRTSVSDPSPPTGLPIATQKQLHIDCTSDGSHVCSSR